MAKTSVSPAIFLDRDGVLIVDHGYVHKIEDVELFPDVALGLKRLKERGFLFLVVTNQSGVARDLFSVEQVDLCHAELQKQLKLAADVQIDEFFVCPHHEKGSRAPYNVACDCRKPMPGMIAEAAKQFNIDWPNSFIVGDRGSDIDAGLNHDPAIRGIQIDRGQYKVHPSPWRRASSFSEAVDHIIGAQD